MLFYRVFTIFIAFFAIGIACSKEESEVSLLKTKRAAVRNGLPLLKDSNFASETLAQIPLGTIIEIQKTSGSTYQIGNLRGSWYFVTYANDSGWIFEPLTSDPDSEVIFAKHSLTLFDTEPESLKDFPLYSQLNNGGFIIIDCQIVEFPCISVLNLKPTRWNQGTFNPQKPMDIESDNEKGNILILSQGTTGPSLLESEKWEIKKSIYHHNLCVFGKFIHIGVCHTDDCNEEKLVTEKNNTSVELELINFEPTRRIFKAKLLYSECVTSNAG